MNRRAGETVDVRLHGNVVDLGERKFDRLFLPKKDFLLQRRLAGILVKRQRLRGFLQNESLRTAFDNGHAGIPAWFPNL
jgi:hypothetical protein